jgi:hypothetical protein
MKIGLWVSAALAAFALGGLARPAEAAEGLSLRRVLLSTGGVGYLEYEARVQGSVDLPLDVRIDQIDDVLKSIVVYDDKGRLGEVSLPGKESLREVFRDLPFDQSALESPAALLGALRGAQIRVEMPDGTLEGRIASVTTEQIKLSTGDVVTRHRLSVLTKGTVRQVLLEDALRVTFVDEALQRQIDEALSALLTQKERGSRELRIHVTGEGERVVRVAYVVEAPLWKTAYRLTLDGDAQAKSADLQGFAVVENRSGHAWEDVDLTLASGDPVTFRQALYDAYYVERPVVPVDVVGHVLPRLDEGALDIAKRHGRGLRFGAPSSVREGAATAPEQPGELAEITPAETAESMSQVVYHLPSPVRLGDGESALLPVIAAAVPAERLSLYQPRTDPRRPLVSARIENDTDGDLPPGAITVYERSAASGPATYLGDARLAPLPIGESRLVSFAVDQKVKIDREEKSDLLLTVATIEGGVLTLKRSERRTTLYTIQGAAREPRTVVLEHPRIQGFEIIEPEESSGRIEATATDYRIVRDVPAGATVQVRVVLARPLTETVKIADLSREQVGVYASSSELPAPVRAALARVAELQAAVADKTALLKRLEAEAAQIASDQARIRENLKVVPAGSDLAKGYLTTLSKQEARLSALEGEIERAKDAVEKARQDLAVHVRSLHL